MRNPWSDEQLSASVSKRNVPAAMIALTSNATNLLNHTVDHLLANRVVATSICPCQ